MLFHAIDWCLQCPVKQSYLGWSEFVSSREVEGLPFRQRIGFGLGLLDFTLLSVGGSQLVIPMCDEGVFGVSRRLLAYFFKPLLLVLLMGWLDHVAASALSWEAGHDLLLVIHRIATVTFKLLVEEVWVLYYLLLHAFFIALINFKLLVLQSLDGHLIGLSKLLSLQSVVPSRIHGPQRDLTGNRSEILIIFLV